MQVPLVEGDARVPHEGHLAADLGPVLPSSPARRVAGRRGSRRRRGGVAPLPPPGRGDRRHRRPWTRAALPDRVHPRPRRRWCSGRGAVDSVCLVVCLTLCAGWRSWWTPTSATRTPSRPAGIHGAARAAVRGLRAVVDDTGAVKLAAATPAEIRRWARARGIEVGPRAAPGEVVQAFKDAHPAPG
ncbi:hypothetical protein HBB16_17995 [Pseudonocardia sp. MCCB 268]|nr:hypothetical protein [Pseudonocardia cytotoxica]